jgi:hypothetical protein
MPSRKALLIASPYGKLKGQLNDVENTAGVLGSLGFTILRCCGDDATRDGIVTALNEVVNSISDGDCIVVYSSGHGGLIEDPTPVPIDTQDLDIMRQPRRYQFLVPTDFDQSTFVAFWTYSCQISCRE